MIGEIRKAVREEAGMSVQDAKRELLDFGEQQSKQFNDTLELWHTRIKHAAPYAAAAAAGMGFIMGKRRTRRKHDDHNAETEPEHRSTRSMAFAWILRTLGPIALEMLTKTRARHQQAHGAHDQPPPAC